MNTKQQLPEPLKAEAESLLEQVKDMAAKAICNELEAFQKAAIDDPERALLNAPEWLQQLSVGASYVDETPCPEAVKMGMAMRHAFVMAKQDIAEAVSQSLAGSLKSVTVPHLAAALGQSLFMVCVPVWESITQQGVI